jgi:dynein light chain roadblock-type
LDVLIHHIASLRESKTRRGFMRACGHNLPQKLMKAKWQTLQRYVSGSSFVALTVSHKAQQAGPDALDEILSRLSKKAGVKATIILDRTNGAILKTSGQISQLRPNKPNSTTTALAGQPTASFSADSPSNGAGSSEPSPAEELAARVWNFVRGAGVLVRELDEEVRFRLPTWKRKTSGLIICQDELKLLRLRTRKQELVIVPDAKYLMILVHDTPPA